MLENREGTRVPEVSFRVRQEGSWTNISTGELFGGKTVVVFSLPGAFTPTCSGSHVPRYNDLAPLFFANGVDDILCVSVNDTFVMNAWKESQGADRVTFVPDGNGAFTEGMGMLVAKDNLGFGKRSWRYSMLVKDGVVAKMFIEPEVEGDPFQVSDADTMLAYIAPKLSGPRDVMMFSKPECGWCRKAKALLDDAGIPYEEVPANPRRLKASSGKSTTPQVFIDGTHVGGYEDLEAWLAKQ